jgi:hypothetical protein
MAPFSRRFPEPDRFRATGTFRRSFLPPPGAGLGKQQRRDRPSPVAPPNDLEEDRLNRSRSHRAH